MTGSARVPVAVLASGTGSNLAALLAATRAPGHPAAIELVLSDRPAAGALAIAADAGVAAEALPTRSFGGDRIAHERAIDARLRASGIGVVCLAGYLRVLTPFLVERWAARMLNIHPSLLPAFPGLDTHRRALASGVAFHGCSVHLVTTDLDAGPILGQAVLPVRRGDDGETIGRRVLAAEHALYPAVLASLLDGDIDRIRAIPRDGAMFGPGPALEGAHDAFRRSCYEAAWPPSSP